MFLYEKCISLKCGLNSLSSLTDNSGWFTDFVFLFVSLWFTFEPNLNNRYYGNNGFTPSTQQKRQKNLGCNCNSTRRPPYGKSI